MSPGPRGAAPSDRATDRQVERLLRGLARHGPARLEPDGAGLLAVEAGGVRREVRVEPGLVHRAASLDLVRIEGGRVALTGAGTARLRRADGPAEAGVPDGDAGTLPFLAQHGPLGRRRIVGEGGAAAEVLVDEAESPLAWLRARRGRDGAALIDETAFQAGERLRADFARANLMPQVTARWGSPVQAGRRGPSEGPAYTEVAVAARQRVHAALDAVGPELSGVLTDVCCFLKGLAEVERERGWPARSGKLVLSLALARLAGHYGLDRRPREGRIRQWGTPDYRPTLRPGEE